VSTPHSRLLPRAVVALASILIALPAAAKPSSWNDARGESFRGEPTEILGPFAIFRVGSAGRRVPLRAFSDEECRRIHAELAQRPSPGPDFARATGEATAELLGRVLRVEGKDLVPAKLDGQAEPSLLLVLSGSHNSGEGWFMANNLSAFYHRLRRIYPNMLEAVFIGTRHDATQHRNIALGSGMPWLVADYDRQRRLSRLARFVPGEGTNVVLVTRQGVPVTGGPADNNSQLRELFDHVTELLWQIDPANPAGWADRLHYLNATRPVEFAAGRGDPVLVGNPFRPEALRQYGVRRIVAKLAVTAEGKVTATLLSGADDVPRALAPAVVKALGEAIVAPAIERGVPVAGTLDYVLEVPPPDAKREAEAFWFRSASYPTLPINEWLVLRPIPVPEKEFTSTVVGQTESGAIMLNSLEVNTGKVSRAAQVSAFASDWFAATGGAGSVRPHAGDRQSLPDGLTLTWEKVRSKGGFVDMQTLAARDYTVGYAWTEFESPADTEAWLGLGSDDGVKIWLNGELVHDQWVRRPSHLDDDVVPLHLRKGANQILIKIQNVSLDWSFVYQLRIPPR